MNVPRLIPEIAFPAYAFVPGRNPHPESDPRGHSYGQCLEPAILEPEQWRTCQVYLFGLDLFNAGFWWEAHAQWEALWHGAGRKGKIADFLKGLIQLAAAGVKHAEAMPAGVHAHARRAAELFRGLGENTFCGFQLSDLVAIADSIATKDWPVSAPVLMPQPFLSCPEKSSL
jgi:hypothetical protein